MKWVEIFKLYNLKQIKKEKILFLFATISILIATTISLIIPQVSLANERYIEKNIEIINGGDLSINLNGDVSKEFQEKISEFKNRGLEVKSSLIENCYYKKSTNNIMGTIVIGDYELKEDEIILQSTLANSLNVEIGDFVELDTQGNGKYKYKVKEIEPLSSGVDRDAELLGYGKVQNNESLNGISGRIILHINGSDGELLKKELLDIDNSNFYITIKDKESEMYSGLSVQKATLGMLSTVGYIFSSLAIISTIIMLILKRKKDIAIFRIISLDIKDIKKALRAEMYLWLLAPITLSGFFSYYGANLILKYSGICLEGINKEGILLILNGMIFNGIVFLILINVALIILQGINAISIIREDEKDIKKQSKKIVIVSIFLVPVLLSAYSLYSGSIESLGSGLIVIFLIIAFLGIVSLSVKVFSLIKFRNTILIYSIKSIKNSFFSFILVLLSLTLTLWFILIGFNIEDSIKDNFTTSLEDILPYNYYAESSNHKDLENVLNNDKDVEGYIKSSSLSGKVRNENFNNIYRSVELSEVNKEDYGVNYKIVMGEDLFQGENGLIISDKMRENNALDVGDILEIETSKGIIKEKIKGVYKSGGINSISIVKENVELGDEISYFIKSKNDNFIESLNNSTVASVGAMGERLAANISSFLKVFRTLSIVCIVGTVLFNINMAYMSSVRDEKDEEILISLGLGKIFVVKSQIVKIILLIFFASMLSLGLYGLIIKIFLKIMINSSGEISMRIIIINLIISVVISIISFNIPLRKTLKKKELNL